MHKKLRMSYWLVLAFVEKYSLYIAASFFVTSFAVALYILFSQDILRFFDQKKIVIGITGKVTINALPPEIVRSVTTDLFRQLPDGTFQSDLVDRWERNADSTVYTLYLKNDLTFTDGTPFTVREISIRFKDVTVERPDDTTIKFTLPRSFPQFLSYLTTPVYTTRPFRGVLGEYILASVKYSKNQDTINELVLTPLTIDQPQKVYKVYDNEADLVNAYKLREIDTFTTTSKAAFQDFKSWPHTTSSASADYDRVVTLFFNHAHDFLKERDVRSAIFGSIPIADLESLGSLAVSPVSPVSPWYDPAIPRIPENPELDRNILRKYFKEASESATFRLSTSFQFLNIAHTVQDIIQGAGGRCTIDVNGLQPGEQADMVLGMWDIPLEVNQYFVWHSSQKGKSNITNYDNKRIDKILEDYRATDSAALQKELMVDFQRKIADDLPAGFLYYPSLYTIARKR